MSRGPQKPSGRPKADPERKRKRVSVYLLPEEIAEAKGLAGSSPLSSWCSGVLVRAIKSARSRKAGFGGGS